MLPPTRRYCLLTPRLYHDLVLRLLHPSAIPTLPITCVCRCGYYYYVRCRLIFRSRALSVVYGTVLAPASTSFSCLSFHLFFSRAFVWMLVVHSQVLSPFLHTQSPSILSPSPSTTRTTNFFFFLCFSQVDYIYPVSFSSAVYSLLYPCILSRHDQRKKCTTHL